MRGSPDPALTLTAGLPALVLRPPVGVRRGQETRAERGQFETYCAKRPCFISSTPGLCACRFRILLRRLEVNQRQRFTSSRVAWNRETDVRRKDVLTGNLEKRYCVTASGTDLGAVQTGSGVWRKVQCTQRRKPVMASRTHWRIRACGIVAAPGGHCKVMQINAIHCNPMQNCNRLDAGIAFNPRNRSGSSDRRCSSKGGAGSRCLPFRSGRTGPSRRRTEPACRRGAATRWPRCPACPCPPENGGNRERGRRRIPSWKPFHRRRHCWTCGRAAACRPTPSFSLMSCRLTG